VNPIGHDASRCGVGVIQKPQAPEIAFARPARHFCPMASHILRVAAIVATLLFGSAPALAETATATREALFAALAEAKTEPEAREIEQRIWKLWLTAPDHESQVLLDLSILAQQRLDHRNALAVLGQLTERAPRYAEGWNQRAIVLFLMGAHEESLEAIERTLALEPKHFGALAGKGIILLGLGRDADGQAALREALKIDPWLKERGLIKDPPERKI
jgi:tetratricopeptide (TPR) repeat protein